MNIKNSLLIFITLLTFLNVSYASFPIQEAEKPEISIKHSFNQDPWYISAKNSLLFLATSVFGFGLLTVFISEAFLVSDFQGWIVVLPLLLAIAASFASVFYGKKIWADRGNFRGSGDGLAKKIVIWTVSVSIFLFLFFSIAGSAGSGMGG